MKNKRKNRQDQIRGAAKYVKGAHDVVSFEAGAKWADYHPYWREDLPKYEVDENGIPKLYLCQILTVDMARGYMHSYRIGFITREGKWNIEQYNQMTRVVRYLKIYGVDDESNLLADIKKYENDLVKEAANAIKKDNSTTKS